MTIPTFSTYQPPGVYVEDVSTPIVIAPGVPSQVLAVAGPALGYRMAVQSLAISSAQAVPLTYKGVYTSAQSGPPPIPAPVVTRADGTVLVLGVDYTFTVTQDPSSNPGLAVTSITRVNSSSQISNGAQVSVVYAYADATYFAPQVFTDYQSVINAYGQPFLSAAPVTPNASQVGNPLSFAAMVAFANGANTLITVALNPADGDLAAQFRAAYAKIANNSAATIVVPVFTDDLAVESGTVAAFAAQLAADLNTAMWSAYNDGFPRIGFFGLPRNYSETDEPPGTFAKALASRRTVFAYPETVLVYNSVTGQVFSASACYLAVALGAILSALPVSTGLTDQSITGFAGLPQSEQIVMTNAFMNALAADGISVCYISFNGNLVCRQGLTTDMSALNRQEISMVRQADTLLVAVRQGLSNTGLIGKPITGNTVATVQEAMTGILEQAIVNDVITDYTNLSVNQQVYPGGSPTVIAVTFQYLPAPPLNYVTVTMAVDLSTGLVVPQSNQNASATGA